MPEITHEDIDNFLEHHGIKGMKWGVRKAGAQGPNKVRVARKSNGKLAVKGGENQRPHDDAIKAAIAGQKARKSGTSSLSNKELKALVERMNLEQQYHSKLPPSKSSKAGKFVSKTVGDILLNSGKQLASEAAKNAMAQAVEQQLGISIKKK